MTLDPDPPSFLENIDPSLILPLLALLLLIVLSALVSGSEVAFFSLSPSELDELKKSENNKDRNILKLLEEPNKLLGSILITNNFVNIAIVILSSIIFTPMITAWAGNGMSFSVLGSSMFMSPSTLSFVLQLVIVTFIILLFGEILPKVYATNNGLGLARFMVGPMVRIGVVVGPLNRLLNKSTGWLKNTGKSENITVTDLEHALDLTEENEEEDEDQKILRGIVKFGSTTARQIMTPRPDVIALDLTDAYDKVMEVVTKSGYSRLPVFEGSFDEVRGTLYIKDLLPFIDQGIHFNWKKLVRDPFFVPENKKIDDLLKEFQEKKIHMAVVVDEFGGTSGVITLEDVIEEIVGEISDEFDEEDLVYSKLDDKNYVFEGKASVTDFCRVLEVDEDIFDEVKGEAESLAGLVLEISGKFPARGQEVTQEKFKFTIESVQDRRIKQIKVTLL